VLLLYFTFIITIIAISNTPRGIATPKTKPKLTFEFDEDEAPLTTDTEDKILMGPTIDPFTITLAGSGQVAASQVKV